MEKNILNYLDITAEKFPDKIAFCDSDGMSISFKQLKRESIMIAANHRGFMDPFIMVGVFYFKRVGVIVIVNLKSRSRKWTKI